MQIEIMHQVKERKKLVEEKKRLDKEKRAAERAAERDARLAAVVEDAVK